jgi:hypothetical protein
MSDTRNEFLNQAREKAHKGMTGYLRHWLNACFWLLDSLPHPEILPLYPQKQTFPRYTINWDPFVIL